MARHADPSTAQAVAALEDVQAGGGLYVAFAVLREAREGRTRNDDPFIDISVGDLSANIGGKVWPDQREAQASVWSWSGMRRSLIITANAVRASM